MSSLAEALAQGGQSGQSKSKAEFRNMQDIVSGERAYKIQIEGEKKTGKTRFCLSIMNYLYFERGLDLEEILFVWIDLDNGLVPLIKQKLIPEELISRIEYHLCTDFGEVLQKTDEAIEMLREHAKKYGPAGAWLIVDNMGKAWEGTRDYYSRTVYGMPMREKLMEAKQRALDRSAAKSGKKSGRIPAQEFDQMTDYGIINPLHNDWADKIKDSNVNFVWTALMKYEETEVRGNKKTVRARGEGQKHNAARVDFILRKKLSEGRFITEMVGSRYTSNLFTNIEDLNFQMFSEEINKIMERESKRRLKVWEERRKERKSKPKFDKEKQKEEPKEEKPPTLEETLQKGAEQEDISDEKLPEEDSVEEKSEEGDEWVL